MGEEYAWLYELDPREGDPRGLADIAARLQCEGSTHIAASFYDHAFALDPSDEGIARARAEVLDSLAVVEHRIVFRYVPRRRYLMGSSTGEADEQPVHPVLVGGFWLSETPVSWASFAHLMDWSPPPFSHPKDPPSGDRTMFMLNEANKIRLQYCEDGTVAARDWHAHGAAEGSDLQELFGAVPREDPRRPIRYDRKPMVSVAWEEAVELANRISDDRVTYRLPTEAEWEAAARGGLVGRRYSWGDAAPSRDICDAERFDHFSILPSRQLPPNGYGLYGMCGGVWEWTSDWYDAEYYGQSPAVDPTGPGLGTERVLRGGSWADCADVVTVSFRNSRDQSPWWIGEWGKHMTPNIGFRLCRLQA
ncbi:formylglycine-generating enzyme family protein [Nonomuraea turkmeniaca]|uniref:Formylglycine-generating enzyme family protein n=1 Tax=Nonomuraea turkmeniaca TaxID=103838 RepID=A0A5S4F5N2_9ACTN|nr:SUMF1/EgtB/PvdO family nonheme iron enzyme [Nonomuraea turkmeniaca]TMR11260.1 formylglycine-generating enzyme family protein [Nonomuraea turkmeniaca]